MGVHRARSDCRQSLDGTVEPPTVRATPHKHGMGRRVESAGDCRRLVRVLACRGRVGGHQHRALARSQRPRRVAASAGRTVDQDRAVPAGQSVQCRRHRRRTPGGDDARAGQFGRPVDHLAGWTTSCDGVGGRLPRDLREKVQVGHVDVRVDDDGVPSRAGQREREAGRERRLAGAALPPGDGEHVPGWPPHPTKTVGLREIEERPGRG